MLELAKALQEQINNLLKQGDYNGLSIRIFLGEKEIGDCKISHIGYPLSENTDDKFILHQELD